MSVDEKRPCRTGIYADGLARQAARSGRLLMVAAGFAALALGHRAAPAAAAEPTEPDWPCIQRLVPELAASQMWAGPSPEGGHDSAGTDGEAAQLAYQLASRSTPLEQAEAAIGEFAAALAPEQRNGELATLFGDVLRLINQERGEIIAGIKRYTRRQQQLAEKIAQDGQQLAHLQPGTTPDAQTQALLEERQWDLRVFEDRRRILTQICEQPVLLEQRAFALSRAMQAELEPN
jgi:hypothetical protein